MSYQERILRFAPPWMLEGHNATLLRACGLQLDAMAEQFHLGQIASIPYAGDIKTRAGLPMQCEPDLLPEFARNTGITIYPNEPDKSKRKRIADRWGLHGRKATLRGVLTNAQPYFEPGTLPTIRIAHDDGTRTTWHSISAAKTYSIHRATTRNFNFDERGTNSAVPLAPAWQAARPYLRGQQVTNDGQKLYRCITAGTTAGSGGPTGTAADITDNTAHWQYVIPWSRWWAFIETSGTAFENVVAHYGDGTIYGGGSIYGGIPAAVRSEIADLFTWKGAHSQCHGLWLSSQPIDITATPTQDADGWWNLPGAGEWGRLIDATTHKPTRPPYLSKLIDRSQP